MQPVQAPEQVRTHLSGRRSFTGAASSGIELVCICGLLDPSQCKVAPHSPSMYCLQAFKTSSSLKHTGTRKTKKNPTTPSKSFYLKCSRKCLIQPGKHLDSPIIHLCIFIERQTAESLRYHVHFLGLSVSLPQRKGREGREVERRFRRQTTEYSSIYSGVCLCMYVRLVPRLFVSLKGIQ